MDDLWTLDVKDIPRMAAAILKMQDDAPPNANIQFGSVAIKKVQAVCIWIDTRICTILLYKPNICTDNEIAEIQTWFRELQSRKEDEG